MKQEKRNLLPYFLFPTILILIFDSKTALSGAISGVEICLHTVIPSLFPLMVFSMLFANSLLGKSNGVLAPIGKLCGIPSGSEPILLTGLLGGYPLGAIALANASKSGHITQRDSNRMLGFCNNCGPAFIFGIGSVLFSSKWFPWMLWLIHIFSAILTGALLKGKSIASVNLPETKIPSVSEVIASSIRSMATICGWIILFKIATSFCQKWFLWTFSVPLQATICGILELTNGFVALLAIPDESLRFLLASAFLAFGGLSVCMQTASQIGELDLRSYLQGKFMQTFLSTILSASALLLTGSLSKYTVLYAISICIFSTVPITLFIFHKKHVDFSKNTVYNENIISAAR